MPINYVVDLVRTPEDGDEKIYTHEHPLGKIGYKSPDCESYRNWDKWTNIEDLVFLRIEYE